MVGRANRHLPGPGRKGFGMTSMGGIGPLIELVGLGVGLGVLGLIGAITAGQRRRPVLVPVRTERGRRPTPPEAR